MTDHTGTIAVFGASGAQGGSVVDALLAQDRFRVRALTRKPDAYTGPAHEAMRADLNDPASLVDALEGAHGVFLVTNFWEPGNDELGQATAAVQAAAAQGVTHFAWSTLPDVEHISGGRYSVPHFTNKAKADTIVAGAGFPFHTFVQPPMYFENLIGPMGPQVDSDGVLQWTLPLPRTAQVIHAGTVGDLGGVVAGAFANPQALGTGSYLSPATLLSFGQLLDGLQNLGYRTGYTEVPGEVFAGFFPGAGELAQMMGYWKEFTYLGPDGAAAIDLARQYSTTGITDFETWARHNFHTPA